MTVGEWDQRQLCPDGGCVGVIGADGTCGVCGRVAPSWGDERNRGLLAPEVSEPGEADAPDGDVDDEPAAAADDDDAPDGEGEAGDWPTRELCADGACIGVIGADGTCKVCGKPAAATAPAAPDPAMNSADPEVKA